MIYQLLALHWVYVGEAIVVSTILAIVPYVFLRSLVRRVAARREPPANAAGPPGAAPHV